jgi:hypothetical protein
MPLQPNLPTRLRRSWWLALALCLGLLQAAWAASAAESAAPQAPASSTAKKPASSNTGKKPLNNAKKTTSSKTAKQQASAQTGSKKSTAKKSSQKTSAKSGKKSRSKTAQSPSKGGKNPPLQRVTISRSVFKAEPIKGPHFTAAKASMALTINGKDIPYQRFFFTTLPNEVLHFVLNNSTEDYELTVDNTQIPGKDRNWHWQAPNTPGLHSVKLVEKLTQKTLNLSLFVLAPLKNGTDAIRGFTIGRYPPPKDGKKEYAAPLGFIEVTPSNQHLYISPHFQLGQFLCKQEGGFPHYVALQPDLLEKLELLLEAVNQRGVRLDTFEVMSGFRTPFYNRLIRNVVHSRHIYGSAADIFIDVNPRDGVMDDLNRDRRFDKKDANVLYDIADAISQAHPHLAGGVGQYAGNGAHGAFVHIDVRGSEARWGK